MQRYEYKVIPAPGRGEKVRGLKTTAERFAHAMTELMNDMARDGWEYLRADTLPCEERSGFTSRTTTYQNLLTFRRIPAAVAAVEMPRALAAPAAPAPAPQQRPLVAAPGLGSFGQPARAPEADDIAEDEPAPALRATAPLGDAPKVEAAPEPGKAPRLGPAD
ncbi:DUF4177 domain-containing protein [Frigidibacter albus]|uniref:DUF4177 domain-containing protein n=1 Tax=Frigidibacter albus TaxID=1465486 RepID=A0A6L8VH14_9RHOB|nr:DUF4177 domain-containing protein [Frigidibacter albus]MZQ88996.1 DUF4177 domain-containing protein [Frigidibacter albus]NBE30947.1 DUF4177 domain-containing protein [Frigidibacter albus]GGH52025.1 DUF4177 domain-containing protein [Frigidibacter albus]